jgi:hypothetical protein
MFVTQPFLGTSEGFARAGFTLIFALAVGEAAQAEDRTYGGFECTDDCSGHAAGYEWAKEHDIEDEANCPEGNSQSFHEGCIAFTEDPNRADPDEDDEGNIVGEEPTPREDGDE